jgi:plastocyanin
MVLRVHQPRVGVVLMTVLGGLVFVQLATAQTEPTVLEVGPDGVQRGQLAVDSYSYTPNYIVVQAGIPVELNLSSLTILTPHNFVLRDQAGGLSIAQDVGAGKTATVRFTAPKPGTYTYYCDKKLLFFASHREKGMEGRLEVR